MSQEKKLIGRREFVGIPDFNIEAIEAKIDTGAYTSALHCSYIKVINEGNKQAVVFKILDEEHPQYNDTEFSSQIHKIKRVKSSNGITQERFIIRATLNINGVELITEFSLTDRSNMRYPVLIGRKTLKGRFLVDVSKLHIGGNPYNQTL
ncbi:MAG: RimK/LysX family protein [Balneolales bacterium]|nr:RimK/LysX family protein [Balneolales bacterium]